MCVIKLHAFIYFLRPPPWSGTGTAMHNNEGTCAAVHSWEGTGAAVHSQEGEGAAVQSWDEPATGDHSREVTDAAVHSCSPAMSAAILPLPGYVPSPLQYVLQHCRLSATYVQQHLDFNSFPYIYWPEEYVKTCGILKKYIIGKCPELSALWIVTELSYLPLIKR